MPGTGGSPGELQAASPHAADSTHTYFAVPVIHMDVDAS
jgi:hypothetical protein